MDAGVVTGLNGTEGDSKSGCQCYFLKNIQQTWLRLTREIDSKNVAVVLVTSSLPEFSRIGSRVNVKVSSIGDAKKALREESSCHSTQGGDGKIYAIASGSISIGGMDAKNGFNNGHNKLRRYN